MGNNVLIVIAALIVTGMFVACSIEHDKSSVLLDIPGQWSLLDHAESQQSHERTACVTDSDCDVIDTDCCLTGKKRVVVHRRFGRKIREDVSTSCQRALRLDKALCEKKPHALLNHRAMCVDNSCKM